MQSFEEQQAAAPHEPGMERNLELQQNARELAQAHLAGLNLEPFLGEERVSAIDFMAEIYKAQRGKPFEHQALRLIYGHNLKLTEILIPKLKNPASTKPDGV